MKDRSLRAISGVLTNPAKQVGSTTSSPSAAEAWRRLLFSIAFLLTVGAALPLDVPLARWCLEGNCPRSLADLLDVTEPFGNGIGVLLILLAIHQLDPLRRTALPRIGAMALGAGLAANLVKMTIVRMRPCVLGLEGSVGDTFGPWLPFLSAGSGGQSFPSAHAATAVGLALALAWLYPRGRWLVAALAVMVACQRVNVGAHFPSDVLCGAAIGWLVASPCLKWAPLAAWFGRLERRLQAGSDSPPQRPILSVRDDRSAGKPAAKDHGSRAA
jgi:membrane-associated phospholipid phosphatase